MSVFVLICTYTNNLGTNCMCVDIVCCFITDSIVTSPISGGGREVGGANGSRGSHGFIFAPPKLSKYKK